MQGRMGGGKANGVSPCCGARKNDASSNRLPPIVHIKFQWPNKAHPNHDASSVLSWMFLYHFVMLLAAPLVELFFLNLFPPIIDTCIAWDIIIIILLSPGEIMQVVVQDLFFYTPFATLASTAHRWIVLFCFVLLCFATHCNLMPPYLHLPCRDDHVMGFATMRCFLHGFFFLKICPVSAQASCSAACTWLCVCAWCGN